MKRSIAMFTMAGLLVGACAELPTDTEAVPDPYGEEVRRDNPLAFWRLNETEGMKAADASDSGLHGQYIDQPTLGAPGLLPGASGTAVRFTDATDDGVEVQDSNLLDIQTFTLEAWVRPEEMVGPEGFVIAGKSYSYHILLDQGRFGVVLINGAHLYAPTEYTPGEVYHVVGVHDGSRLSLYVNGTQVAATAADPAPLSNWPFHIGRGASVRGRFNWKGVIDEVALYTGPLSAERIRAHYEAGRSRS